MSLQHHTYFFSIKFEAALFIVLQLTQILLNIPLSINCKFSFFFAELVEKVFLKFVVADTDEKLEKSFYTFLTPVLLKLGSKSEAVRNKVCILLLLNFI